MPNELPRVLRFAKYWHKGTIRGKINKRSGLHEFYSSFINNYETASAKANIAQSIYIGVHVESEEN